jgi:hypothetical protein
MLTNFLPRGVIVRFTFAMNSSMYSSDICHFMPLPGSSVRRGTLTNALLRERLWRIEFYVRENKRGVVPANHFLCTGRRHIGT